MTEPTKAALSAEQDLSSQIGFIRSEMQGACPSVRPNDREWILALIVTEVEKAHKASRRRTLKEVIAKLRKEAADYEPTSDAYENGVHTGLTRMADELEAELKKEAGR